MRPRKTSCLGRLFNWLIFPVLVVGLVLGVLWSGSRVVQAVVQRVNEVSEINQRSLVYAGTVTAIAPTLTTHTASPTFEPTATDTATNTLTATDTATTVATDTETPVPTEAATEVPDTETPVVVADVPSETAAPLVVAQVPDIQFVTNTPRPQATLAPSVIPTSAPTLIPTLEPTIAPPTATLTETATLTATLIPTDAPTLAPTVTQEMNLPTILPPNDPDPNIQAATAIPSRVPPIDRMGYDLVNILLLGGDAEMTGDDFTRTDTMIILSINRTTGTVAMMSLPRDLYVYIPSGRMERLNLAYVLGESGGWTDGGFGMMRQTLFYNLGINVHYYALVDISDVRQIVDMVGGVDVGVDCALQDYQIIGTDLPVEAVQANTDLLYTLPVGYYHLSGGQALWYARSRHNSSDFDRGRRQQQILRAIWRQARNTGQLASLPQLWTEGTQIVETNIPTDVMVSLLPIALNLGESGIENFTLVRTYHTTPWQTPSGDFVQIPNYDVIQELLVQFYTPPTQTRIFTEAANVAVYNGTSNANLDRVAAERLQWDSIGAVAAGAADRADYTDTILIDHTGSEKGSSVAEVVRILNIRPENVLVQPDPNRTVDIEVILGSNYSSCSFAVLAPEEFTPTPPA